MTSAAAPRDIFLDLLGSSENRLRAFIPGALTTADDRADFFQDVVLILWRKFDQYDAARPFLPWAMGIAVWQAGETLDLQAVSRCSRMRLFDDRHPRINLGKSSGNPGNSPNFLQIRLGRICSTHASHIHSLLSSYKPHRHPIMPHFQMDVPPDLVE